MLLQACLNGSRPPGAHPALPLTPRALAEDARLAVAAGAGALHVHPRDAAGAESLADQDIAAALTAIRDRCPGVPVGVSTGLWIAAGVEQRLQLVQAWKVLPDFVSINFSEPGASDLCAQFLACQVGIEAGLWSVEDAQHLLALGLADRCLRLLIEPQEPEVESAMATAEAILRCLDASAVQVPILLHGDHEAVVWPLLDFALERGYDTRIGLEDTLTLPDGSRATDNAQLVALAMARARQLGAV